MTMNRYKHSTVFALPARCLLAAMDVPDDERQRCGDSNAFQSRIVVANLPQRVYEAGELS